MYNSVNLTSEELSRAEQEAERIFTYAGIQVTWAAGLLESNLDKTADEAAAQNPPAFQLRVWPRAAAAKRPTGAATPGLLPLGEMAMLSCWRTPFRSERVLAARA